MTHGNRRNYTTLTDATWDRTGERAGAYVAVQIDDPAFVQPLRANLLRSMSRHDEYHLLWTRPTHRDRR